MSSLYLDNLVKRQTHHDTDEDNNRSTIIIVVVVVVSVYFFILGSVLCSFLICFVHCDDYGKPYRVKQPCLRCPKKVEDSCTACCARACCSSPDDWDSSETGYRIEIVALVIVCCPLVTFCALLYGYATGQ